MRCPEGPLWLAALVGSWLASLAAFSLWPGIDLWVSGLFHTPEEGFWLARSPVANALRSAVWHCSQAMVGLAAVALGLAAARRPVSGFGARPAVFVLALYMFGPGLVVDFGLKDHWGRARPATVAEFGGGQEFTPAFLPADQCDRNCSFVSGEGAAATALALSMAVAAPAVRAAVPVALYRLFLVLAVAAPATGIALRVLMGRHFLSDTVVAMLIVTTIAFALCRLLRGPRVA